MYACACVCVCVCVECVCVCACVCVYAFFGVCVFAYGRACVLVCLRVGVRRSHPNPGVRTLQVPELLSILWDTLLDLDDLTASTSSVMALLAALLAFDNVRAVVGVCRLV